MSQISSQKTLSPVGRQTLTARVYDHLLTAICSGQLPPGEKLIIDNLARELSVSITPVREALMRLEREGLVTETPYSGMQVTQFSVEELMELFAIRGLLEGFAVKKAVAVLTDADIARIGRELEALEDATRKHDSVAFREYNTRFHDAILNRAGGRALPDLIAQFTRNTERYRAAGTLLDQDYLEASQAEHRELFKLLQERKADEAEKLVREHALTFASSLVRHVSEEKSKPALNKK
jgi:DNA-binding GntR family transcriptional regulator